MEYQYQGSELEVFAGATNWKSYVSKMLRPHIRGRVLEVGAGIGSNTKRLLSGAVTEWTCLEPDLAQSKLIGEKLPSCRVVTGTLQQIDPTARFDTILYLDVMEHIEDDTAEAAQAASLLANGGKLVVLAPAHQFLYSPFDQAIGHYRRYNGRTLSALSPPACRLRECFMLDSVGFMASLSNQFLRASMPTAGQIRLWDRVMVPISRVIDPIIRYRFGKTVVVVWSRAEPPRHQAEEG